MSLIRKLRSFFSLAGKQQLMVVEAVLLLAVARFLVAFFPFKAYQRTLGKVGAPLPIPNDIHLAVADEVRKNIVMAARNVPWKAVCLPQAMAGRWMLKRRGIDSVLYLGVESRAPEKKFGGHAWLEAGSMVVTGWREMENFTVIAKFT